MSNPPPVTTSLVGKVGIIEMARPDKFNCLSNAAFAAIDNALTDFERHGAGVRAILIRAQGKNFCTGADLDELKMLRGDKTQLATFIQRGHDVLQRLEASPLPVVAAVQGFCLAGGLELMLACDVVFASQDARIGDQHAQFGLVPGWGGSQRLPRVLGLRRSLDLLLSARWLDAQTALQWGLVNYLCAAVTLHEESMAYCAKLCERSRGSLATMKRLARAGMNSTLTEGLRLEVEEVVGAMFEDDVTEGLAAFEARRAPVFKS
jgi:enoyl-CoA hydratase